MSTILVVDDDEALRGIYRRRLSDSYRILDTGDPEQALALALENKPAAIILDLKMPKFNGFELVRNFRSLTHTADLPIFVVTGQSGKYKDECTRLGATGYFEKPIDFIKLKRTLAVTLQRKPGTARAPLVLPIKVRLRLRGPDAAGQEIVDVVETKAVSCDGFEFLSAQQFRRGAAFEVFLVSHSDHFAGTAVALEGPAAGGGLQRYRFQFNGETSNWVLQKKA